jgi:L-serine dehydratase
MAEIIAVAEAQNMSVSEITLRQTAKDTEKSEVEVFRHMAHTLDVMKESVINGLDADLRSASGLSGGEGFKVKQYVEGGHSISGGFMGEAIYNALAIAGLNACMGKIVAAPTAGSSGILPACLIAMQKQRDLSDKALVAGLLNASAVGLVIAKNASISGAEGGCQAECCAAAAMAASAMTELAGGTPTQCGHAVAHALKSLLGLVCDPVAGLVEEPCVVRNAGSTAVAVMAAELALAGVESVIPADEVIVAMGEIGRQMPENLRETAKGGLATTKTGKAIAKRLESI